MFCTLQDIEGDEKKAKHAEIYKFAKRNSFLIVDETHNGGRGITFSKKIKQIGTIDDTDEEEIEFAGKANEVSSNFGFVNQLHLSGTPAFTSICGNTNRSSARSNRCGRR